MASERLKSIAHEFLKKLGQDTDSMFVRMELLPTLTEDERKDIAILKQNLDEFQAELDNVHTLVEAGW